MEGPLNADLPQGRNADLVRLGSGCRCAGSKDTGTAGKTKQGGSVCWTVLFFWATVNIHQRIDDEAGIVLKDIAPIGAVGQGDFPGKLEYLIKKAAFDADCFAKTIAQQEPDPVLVEYVFVDVFSKADKNFVVGGSVKFLVVYCFTLERALHPKHIAQPVDEEVFVFAGHFWFGVAAYPALFEHEPM